MLKTERVRMGEWNEALCFINEDRPLTEIAVQKCKDHWNIFYTSSKKVLTIVSGIDNQVDAENIGEGLALDILYLSNPYNSAVNAEKKSKQTYLIEYGKQKGTIEELLDALDGGGLIITDLDLIEDTLNEMGLSLASMVDKDEVW